MKTRGHPGFTLLELAVVLMIIAIITGMAVKSGIGVVATARLDATQLKIKTINDALMQYRTANDRLPCPGDLTLAPGSADYGLEAGADTGSAIGVGTGVCFGAGMLPAANFTGAGATNTFATAAEGALPAVTLGLSPDMMLDGWGNKIRYAVDVSYTANGAFVTAGASCLNGAITVNDGNGVARSSNSIYALISHGLDGHGAYSPSGAVVNAGSSSADQLTNCHCASTGATNTSSGVQTTMPATYVQKLPAYDASQTGNSAYYYDDVVSYKERWQMRTDWDMAGACQYIYVADAGNNRVEKFDMNGNFISQLGCASGTCTTGSGAGQFNVPYWVGIDAKGDVWVSDWNNIRMQEFDSHGNYLNVIGGNWNYGYPYGIAIDKYGYIWSYHGLLGKYNNSTVSLLQVNLPYYGEGVAVDSSANVYVADFTDGAVKEYNNSGTLINSFTPTGAAYINNFTGIAVDSGGNIWAVASWTDGTQGGNGSNSVFKYSNSGTYLAEAGCGGVEGGCYSSATPGYFFGPEAVAVDPQNNVWITDSGNNRVQEFNSSGTFIKTFGSSGSGKGQFNGPVGIAVGSR